MRRMAPFPFLHYLTNLLYFLAIAVTLPFLYFVYLLSLLPRVFAQWLHACVMLCKGSVDFLGVAVCVGVGMIQTEVLCQVKMGPTPIYGVS